MRIKKSLICILLIIVSCVLASCNNPDTDNDRTPAKANEALRLKYGNLANEAKASDDGMIHILAVLCGRDEAKKTFTVRSIKGDVDSSDYNKTSKDYLLKYSGGTDIANEYDAPVSQGQLNLGEVVNITYDPKKDIVTAIKRIKSETSIKNIRDYKYAPSARTIGVGDKTYTYDSDTVFIDEDALSTESSLSEYDEITIYGDSRRIYSVIINKGHGKIKLTGYSQFIGGYIDIGSKIMKVTENMVIDCTEGTYKVILSKDDVTAVKNITVRRNDEVVVAFDEFVKPASKQGSVLFKVSPVGARVYVDGVKIDSSKTVELAYGTHTVTVVASGYDNHMETVIVDTIYQEIVIDMDGTQETESATKESTSAASTSSAATKSTVASTTATTRAESTSATKRFD